MANQECQITNIPHQDDDISNLDALVQEDGHKHIYPHNNQNGNMRLVLAVVDKSVPKEWQSCNKYDF